MKHIDIYWPKVFDIQNAAGERKYTLLSKVVKNCLSLQNSNASVERSFIKEMQVAYSNYITGKK